jgi:hypothetical protein
VDADPVDQLDREWRQLAHGPLRARMPVWSVKEPALARFADPLALIRFLRSGDGWAEKDRVLAALLRLAFADPEAARVLLEALLPGLKRLAERVILDGVNRDALRQLLLASLWGLLRGGYPLARRPSRIAANLLLETRRLAVDALAEELLPRGGAAWESVGAGWAGDIDALFARAVAAGALSAEEAELILQSRIDGRSLDALAREEGCSYHALVVRRIRAERRLFLFLGYPAVTFRHRNPHCLSARVAG